MTSRVRFVRITTKEGAKDRFLTSQTFAPPPDKTQMGRLFVVIEITKRWLSTAQIGQKIIGLFPRSYYQMTSTSDLENFEQTISQINRLLVSTLTQGDTDWIGNLHCALILTNSTNIHIATTGDIIVWLIRNHQMKPLTESTDPEDIDSTKVFSTIVSGTIQTSDRLFVGSPLIFDHLTKNQIQPQLNEPNIYESGLKIAQLLRKNRIKETAALIVQPATGDEDQIDPAGTVIYLDENLQSLTKTLAKFQKRLSQTAASAIRIIQSKIAPAIMASARQTVESAKQGTLNLKTTAGRALLPKVQQLTKRLTKLSKISLPDLTNQPTSTLIGKNLYSIYDYQNNRSTSYRLPASMRSKRWPLPILLGKLNHIQAVKFSKISTPLILAIVLLMILIVSTIWQKKRSIVRAKQSQYQHSIQQAQKRLEDGKTALVFNNKSEAQAAFSDSLENAQRLTTETGFDPKLPDIIKQAQAELDRLTNTTRLINLQPKFTSSMVNYALVHNGRLLVVNTTDPIIKELDPVSGVLVDYVTLSAPPRPLTPIMPDGQIFILTNQSIEKINLENQEITVYHQPQGVDLPKTKAFGIFGTHLYFLEPEYNQIDKYTIQSETLERVGNYLKRGEVKNSLSLTIDGAIYVLKADGTVVKFSRGEKQDFKLSEIPKPNNTIEQPLQIDTDESIASIFIADAKVPRILEFDKTGKYLHQYILPTDKGELKSVFYQFKGRKAWVVLGDGVYEVNL